MTAGQDALREAARLESALVYGGVRVQHDGPNSVTVVRAEAALASRAKKVDRAIRAGMTNTEIMQATGLPYREVQAARRRTERDA